MTISVSLNETVLLTIDDSALSEPVKVLVNAELARQLANLLDNPYFLFIKAVVEEL